MNCPAMPPGGGMGMKFRNPFRPKTRKIRPARYRAIVDAVLMCFSFALATFNIVVKYLGINIVDEVCLWKIQVFYGATRSKHGPRLAGNDEGDARPDKVRSR